MFLVCSCRLWLLGWCCRPFRAEGERSASSPQPCRTPFHCPPAWPLTVQISIFASESSAISPMQAAALVYLEGLTSRLGRGLALVRARACPGLVCVFLSGARLLGLLLGAGRAAAVSLPSSGGRAGFSVCRFKTKSGGLFMAQGFVTVFSRTSRVFSLVRLVVWKQQTTTANSRLRNHSAKPPSLQKAWRK